MQCYMWKNRFLYSGTYQGMNNTSCNRSFEAFKLQCKLLELCPAFRKRVPVPESFREKD